MSNRTTQAVTAVPIILVNTVAVLGQYAYLRDHLPWPFIGVVIFAAALESVALYLAYMAHKSLISMDSSMRLRLGAIGFGLLAGFMNASHYERHGHITFVSVATGLMSASSPILWGIYSRRQSRDKLTELGLIEPGAVRLGSVRWLMYPIRSFRVFRFAAWDGIRTPGQAIARWEDASTKPVIPEPDPDIPELTEPDIPALSASERDSERDSDAQSIAGPGGIATARNKSQAVSVALSELPEGTSAPDVAAWLAERSWDVAPAYVRLIRSRITRKAIDARRNDIRALPSGRESG